MPDITISDDRWVLPNGELVGASQPFELNGMQYLNGVSGLSDEQASERGIVKMTAKPDEKYAQSTPDTRKGKLGEWIIVPVSDEDRARLLKQYAAKCRWEKETGGLTVGGKEEFSEQYGENVVTGGIRVTTDAVAQQKISELRRRSEAGEIALPFYFKAANGWYPLDLETIVGIDRTIAAHVQACYALEKSISERIDSGELTTEEQVTTAFSAA